MHPLVESACARSEEKSRALEKALADWRALPHDIRQNALAAMGWHPPVEEPYLGIMVALLRAAQ